MKKFVVALGLICIVYCVTAAQLPPVSQAAAQSGSEADYTSMIQVSRQGPYGDRDSEALKKLKTTELRHLEDTQYRKMLEEAREFWRRYPDDPRRLEALSIFLTVRPGFFQQYSPEIEQALSDVAAKARAPDFQDRGLYWRSQPYDGDAIAAWKAEGEGMVMEVLSSSKYSREDKENTEWRLFVRNFHYANLVATRLPSYQPLEAVYWTELLLQMVAQFQTRFDVHVMRYADMPVIADRAHDYVSGLERHVSSDASIREWSRFLAANPYLELQDKPGVQAILAQAPAALKALHEFEAMRSALAEGRPVEMKFTALDGREVDLAKLRGKVVLLDFWATWCTPCVAELPHVKAMYDTYRRSGFEVIGISLDNADAKPALEKLVKKHGASWPQRFEGMGMGDMYARLFEVEALPAFFLVDRKGMIVERNARGPQLEPLLQKYLNAHAE